MTDAVLDEVAAWHARPLEAVYRLVFFDAPRIKIRDEGLVRNKAVHVALGVRADGTEEIVGLWLEQNEGAKFWLRVMKEMKNRGVEDILIAVVDGQGLSGSHCRSLSGGDGSDLYRPSFAPQPRLRFYKDRKAVAAALKGVYRAKDPVEGEAALAAFEDWRLKASPIAALFQPESESRIARARSASARLVEIASRRKPSRCSALAANEDLPDMTGHRNHVQTTNHQSLPLVNQSRFA